MFSQSSVVTLVITFVTLLSCICFFVVDSFSLFCILLIIFPVSRVGKQYKAEQSVSCISSKYALLITCSQILPYNHELLQTHTELTSTTSNLNLKIVNGSFGFLSLSFYLSPHEVKIKL